MFLFLLSFISAELIKGDDPYKILGLPRSAIRSEIKAAYKKLTIELHPDVNKEKDAQEKWIRVNEAYEILNDPDRKARFDKFGRLDQEDSLEGTDSKDYRYFGSDNKETKKRTLTSINQTNFVSFTNRTTDYMFLIYSSILCDDCDMYLDLFEEFNIRFGKMIRCAILDISENAEIAKELGTEAFPSFVFMKKTENNTIKVTNKKKMETVRNLADFWTDQYPSFINVMTTEKQLYKFLHNDKTAVHVLQVVRHVGATVSYKKLASILKNHMIFGVFIDPSFQASKRFNITSFPEVLVYRNPDLKPLHFGEMKQVASDILKYVEPILFHVDGFTFNRHCSEFCFVRCNYPPAFQAQQLVEINYSVGYVKEDSQFAKSLQMVDGEWVAVFPEALHFARVNKKLDDKATLKYFWDDHKKKKIKFQELPPTFGFPMTFDAFWGEFSRFLVFFYEAFSPAFPYIGFAISALFLNKYLKSRKQAPKKAPVAASSEKKHKE